MVAAERLALFEDADEHRDDARVAFSDERLGDRFAHLAAGRTQHRLDRARRRRIVDRAERRDRLAGDARIALPQQGLQQRHPFSDANLD